MLISIVAAAVVGAAFYLPGTGLSLLLGWLAAILIAVVCRGQDKLYRRLFVFGLVLHCGGFYWLPATLRFFGGFPDAAAYLLFALYAAVSSLQFIFCGWLLLLLRRSRFEQAGLALPAAWFVSEFLIPRLFPWSLAQTQIAWSGFASLAEIAGTIPLSFVLLWTAGLIVEGITRKQAKQPRLRPAEGLILILILFAIGAGHFRASQIRSYIAGAEKIKAGLIQGNLDAIAKRDPYQLETNLSAYAEQSARAESDGAEVVFWPESVVPVWLPENRASISGTEFAPFLNLDVPLVFGGLSYRLSDWSSPPRAAGQNLMSFNSALLIDSKLNIKGLYHKRVLMPFGEYMPFSGIFPWIKELSPNSGEFSVGDRSAPFDIPRRMADGSAGSAKAAMLICYEDLVPWMTREAVNNGAQFFAAVTNDAWYGQTAAPYQHNLLAAWRSIETRRALLRVTNTGLTAMISPLGEIVNPLPIFERSYTVVDVPLLSVRTPYAAAGDLPAWIAALAVLIYCLFLRQSAV